MRNIFGKQDWPPLTRVVPAASAPSVDAASAIRYVAGFALTPNSVLLVRKTQPVQLAGKWNAVGGKCEPGELPATAMAREFLEETGTRVAAWHHYCSLRGKYPLNGSANPSVNFSVEFYYAQLEAELNAYECNDVGEELFWCSYKMAANPALVLPNVTWLLPMARSFAFGERAASFVVEEQYAPVTQSA